MRALVLGGTRFLGRHLAALCLARGHDVTLMHRGLSFPTAARDPVLGAARHVIGDRLRNLDPLRETPWDVVFDTSGFEVPEVRAAIRAVARESTFYVFVSSVSVYADLNGPLDEETGITRRLDDAEHATLSFGSYGALKAACERAVGEMLPGRSLSVRAGLLLGPHDCDERFPWWLRRVARGGDVLAPGDPDRSVQLVDVRDAARFMVDSAERRLPGVFNVTGPAKPLTMRELLETLLRVTASDARLRWVPDEVLVAAGVAPYSEMPFWLPAALGHACVDNRRGCEAGLTFRPFEETARDTWRWLVEGGFDAQATARAQRRLVLAAGITPEREAQLLARSTQAQ